MSRHCVYGYMLRLQYGKQPSRWTRSISRPCLPSHQTGIRPLQNPSRARPHHEASRHGKSALWLSALTTIAGLGVEADVYRRRLLLWRSQLLGLIGRMMSLHWITSFLHRQGLQQLLTLVENVARRRLTSARSLLTRYRRATPRTHCCFIATCNDVKEEGDPIRVRRYRTILQHYDEGICSRALVQRSNRAASTSRLLSSALICEQRTTRGSFDALESSEAAAGKSPPQASNPASTDCANDDEKVH